jgi:hypothetical protein
MGLPHGLSVDEHRNRYKKGFMSKNHIYFVNRTKITGLTSKVFIIPDYIISI